MRVPAASIAKFGTSTAICGTVSRCAASTKAQAVPNQLRHDPVPAMTNDTHRDLWCFIKGDPNAFEVTAPINASIARLKKLVWEQRKNGVLRGIDAADLVLLKVS